MSGLVRGQHVMKSYLHLQEREREREKKKERKREISDRVSCKGVAVAVFVAGNVWKLCGRYAVVRLEVGI